MSEKHENRKEEECVIKVFPWKLKYNGRKAACRQRIQVSSNLEQVVMFWLINKNSVELEIIIYTLLKITCSKVANIFVLFKNVWWSRLSFETQLKMPVAEKSWK